MTRDITPIFQKYNSDKKEHGYLPYYQKHLPDTAARILEIGVKEGESIKIWHELYPDAKIFGLDLFEEYHEPFHESWVTWFKGNQSDSRLLDTVRLFGKYDIIIDDGSHRSRHQLMTFYGLVGTANLYVVEDLHCCKEEFWRDGMNTYDTMLGQMVGNVFPFEYDIYNDKIGFIYG